MPSSPESSATSHAHATRQRLTGIGLLLCAVACFASIDACAKWLNRSMHPMQTVTLRYLGSFVLIGFMLNPRRHPGIMRTNRLWLQCARATCLVVMSMCIFTSVRYLPLTVITSIAFVAPLLTAVLAAPMLGEKLGPRRVVAVGVGFCGVIVVTRPWSGSFHPAMLLVVITACLNALYSITTRMLAAHDKPETTMFYTGLVAAIVVCPLFFYTWQTPTALAVWGVVLLFSIFGTLGHWLLILAHARAPASLLAPFFYTQIIWATTLGTTIFGESPDRWTILGGAIVMSSGLYLLYRERVRHQQPSVDMAV